MTGGNREPRSRTRLRAVAGEYHRPRRLVLLAALAIGVGVASLGSVTVLADNLPKGPVPKDTFTKLQEINKALDEFKTAVKDGKYNDHAQAQLDAVHAIEEMKLAMLEKDFPHVFGRNFKALYSPLECIDSNASSWKRITTTSVPSKPSEDELKGAKKCTDELTKELRAGTKVPEEVSNLASQISKLVDELVEKAGAQPPAKPLTSAHVLRNAEEILKLKSRMLRRYFPRLFGSKTGLPYRDVYTAVECVDNGLTEALGSLPVDEEQVIAGVKRAKDCKDGLEEDLTKVNEKATSPKCPIVEPKARFAQAGGCFTLTVTKSGTGTGVVVGDPASGINCGATCSVTVASGTTVPLVPTADAGSVFDGWTGGCGPGTVSCQVTVTSDVTVNAIFDKVSATNKTAAGALTNGGGSVLGYSIETNTTADAFELILPSTDDATQVSPPSGFTCADSGHVEFCDGSVPANTPLVGSFDHTGTIAANCGCMQVAFSQDGGHTWYPNPPATMTGPSSQSPPPAPSYTCTGSPTQLYNNWNTAAVANGGTPPSFGTGGHPYCLVSIATYHWNGGSGMTPGTIGLSGPDGELGPWEATGNPAPNANVDWTATVPTSQPVIINGTYSCEDSDPTTWSQNPTSGGQGFCKVFVETAQLG